MMISPAETRFNLNGVLYDRLPDVLAQFGRAYMYGDGIFESIRMFSSKMPLWKYHADRLNQSLLKLSITLPESISPDVLREEILKTASGNSRIRLMLWRNTGGLYLPDQSDAIFLISVSHSSDARYPVHESGLTVSLSQKIQVPVDYYSGIKSLSASRYVNAAMEARERNLDDVLLLNSKGNVCESSNSNIFWISNNEYFTTPDGDGQIQGVFQQFLRETLYKSGISVTEKPCTFASLLQADEILLTNAVTGIRWVRQLGDVPKTGLNARLLTETVNSQLSL